MSEPSELEDISLMDLAGLDTTGMESRRIGDILPKILADFTCTEADLGEVQGEKKMFTARFKFQVDAVHKITDKDYTGTPEDLIGKFHEETRFITNSDGVAFVLGFLEDIGVKERGKLGELVEKAKGKSITAIIAHRKDKNDSDKVYSGLAKIKAK